VDKKVLAEGLDGLNYVLDIFQIAQKAIVFSQFLAISSSKDLLRYFTPEMMHFQALIFTNIAP
jgi:hypothetical protein